MRSTSSNVGLNNQSCVGEVPSTGQRNEYIVGYSSNAPCFSYKNIMQKDGNMAFYQPSQAQQSIKVIGDQALNY
jgi:hypothetical protein